MCSSAHVLRAEEHITAFEELTQTLRHAQKFGKIEGEIAKQGTLKDKIDKAIERLRNTRALNEMARGYVRNPQ